MNFHNTLKRMRYHADVPLSCTIRFEAQETICVDKISSCFWPPRPAYYDSTKSLSSKRHLTENKDYGFNSLVMQDIFYRRLQKINMARLSQSNSNGQ